MSVAFLFLVCNALLAALPRGFTGFPFAIVAVPLPSLALAAVARSGTGHRAAGVGGGAWALHCAKPY